MRWNSRLVAIASALILAVPVGAQQPPQPAAPPPAPVAPQPPVATADEPGNPLPVVGAILDRATQLGLSSAQVDKLEQLGLDVVRDAIRRQADLTLAQLDLSTLVDREPTDTIDMAKVESKIREVERMRSGAQLAVVRTVEVARNVLTPEQRSRLVTLGSITGIAADDPLDWSGGGDAARAASGGAPRPGAPGPRPGPAPHPGARPHPGAPHPGGPRPHVEHRGGVRGHVFFGVTPWWTGPVYPYWNYPAWSYAPPMVVEPPVYIQQQPTYWYYCPSANAYYPYVQTCPESWILVTPSAP